MPTCRRHFVGSHDGERDPRDARTGKNERHALVGLLRQSVFGRKLPELLKR
jgi:hypothetical protein